MTVRFASCLVPLFAAVFVAAAEDTIPRAAPAADIAAAPAIRDTVRAAAAKDTTVRLPDTLSAPAAPAPDDKDAPRKIALIKRSYGRQQVILGVGMMVFVVAIMTAAQQWNPR